jgi:predicted transcriptional regulator
MRVLLSIKPEYASKIFDGTKKFEFRKIRFKNPDVTTVVVYASSPVQQVIGEFEIDKIVSLNPNLLWEETKKHSGISKDFFFEYFQERDMAHAIKIKSTKRYEKPLSIKDDFHASPPQSYIYID